MQVMYERCCGVDVHKKLVVACLWVIDKEGKRRKQVRSFNTMTCSLLEMVDWLKSEGCVIVAMESTGVYWKPLYNLLEGELEVWVVNAAHMKAVPGRKTDAKDAEWIGELLQYGLLKASFIPPAPQRELRELTRYRSALVADRAQLINRLQKVLEDANLKLASVVTDITGVSGRAMLKALAQGEQEISHLVELAKGRLKLKLAELEQALEGRIKPHHCFMLSKMLDQLAFYDEQITAFGLEIEQRLDFAPSQIQSTQTLVVAGEKEAEDKTIPSSNSSTLKLIKRPGESEFELTPKVENSSGSSGGPLEQNPPLSELDQALKFLDSIPGVNRRVGEIVLAEIGLDMGRFPSAAHLASWAGMCPGHKESGGKRLSGRTTKGSRWLRQALVEAAQAALHTRDTYLSAQGRRLTVRLGRKKAVVAVAHSILVIIYHLLLRREYYKELGGDYFHKLDQENIKKRALRQLESLGYTIELQKVG